jgi:WD40 repeat protein
MTKKKNDFHIIEEPPKPKRKPKPPAELPRGRLLIIGLILVLILLAISQLLLATRPQVVVVAPTLIPSSTPIPLQPSSTPLPTFTPTLVPPLPGDTPAPTPTPIIGSPSPFERVLGLSWSMDGRWLAVQGLFDLYLYNPHDLTQTPHRVQGYQGQVEKAIFSPDSQTLAIMSNIFAANSNGTFSLDSVDVTLWDVQTQATRLVLTGVDNWARALTFSQDSSLVAAGIEDDGQIQIWDAQTGAPHYRLQSELRFFEDLRFDEEGRLHVVGVGEDTANGGQQVHMVETWFLDMGPDESHVPEVYDASVIVYLMQYSPNSKRLAVAMRDELWIEDGANQQVLKKLPNLEGSMGTARMTFSPDGKLLAVADTQFFEGIAELGGILRLWDLESEQARFTLESPRGTFNGLAFSPDGTKLACGSTDGSLQIVDVQTGAVLMALVA